MTTKQLCFFGAPGSKETNIRLLLGGGRSQCLQQSQFPIIPSTCRKKCAAEGHFLLRSFPHQRRFLVRMDATLANHRAVSQATMTPRTGLLRMHCYVHGQGTGKPHAGKDSVQSKFAALPLDSESCSTRAFRTELSFHRTAAELKS